jgi:hypothetical protein
MGFEAFLSTFYATTQLATCPSPVNVAPPSSWLPEDDYVQIK